MGEGTRRRDFLKGGAAAGLALLSGGSTGGKQGVLRSFRDLRRDVEERREWRYKNPGSTIYLGNINSYGRGFSYVGDVENEKGRDMLSSHRIEELLDSGADPGYIVEELPDGVELEVWNSPAYRLVEEKEIDFRIIHMEERGRDLDLESYADVLEGSFQELLGSDYDVSARTSGVETTAEDRRLLANVTTDDISSLEADFGLKDRYSARGERPIFLVDRDLLPEATGNADYVTDVAFVELKGNEERNMRTMVHEAGHSAIYAPHTYLREGPMSYNPVAGKDTEFGEQMELYRERFEGSRPSAEVEDSEYTIRVLDRSSGEMVERRVEEKSIVFGYELGTADPRESARVMTDNLFTYLEEHPAFRYDTSRWEPLHAEPVGVRSGAVEVPGDLVVSRHETEDLYLSMTITDFIEDLSLSSAPPEPGPGAILL